MRITIQTARTGFFYESATRIQHAPGVARTSEVTLYRPAMGRPGRRFLMGGGEHPRLGGSPYLTRSASGLELA